MKLTRTERTFIRTLVEIKEKNYSEVAKKLKITKQAVSRMNRNLSDKDVIHGWNININAEKVGINTYAIFEIDLLDDIKINDAIREIKKRKEIINIMESTMPTSQLFVIGGFTDIKSIDRTRTELKRQFPELIGNITVKIVHAEKVHKDSKDDLIASSLIER